MMTRHPWLVWFGALAACVLYALVIFPRLTEAEQGFVSGLAFGWLAANGHWRTIWLLAGITAGLALLAWLL